jgi:hypothetical protein
MKPSLFWHVCRCQGRQEGRQEGRQKVFRKSLAIFLDSGGLEQGFLPERDCPLG